MGNKTKYSEKQLYCASRSCAENRKELAYLRKLSEQSMAKILSADAQSIIVKQALEQKKRCFALMAELNVNLGDSADCHSVLLHVSRRLNAALNMEKTVILIPSVEENVFRPSYLEGYSPQEKVEIEAETLRIPPEMFDASKPVIVNNYSSADLFTDVRNTLHMDYFISSPILLHEEVVAIVITSRCHDSPLFMAKINSDDLETLHAMCIYLGYMLTGQRLLEAENLAYYDPLTQLPNLRRTKEGLNQIITLAKRGKFSAAIMFLDLDGFKAVNDTFGHTTGDFVLKVVADRMIKSVRESDFVGRYGGDEFVIALAHITKAEDACIVAAKIINKLAEPIYAGNNVCRIGVSIGISIFPDHGDNAASLLKIADEVMYEVKRNGKKSFMLYKNAYDHK